MKTAKITSVEFKKKLEFGNVYAIEFDNHDSGEAIEKVEPVIGEEWQYDIQESQYGDKIKRVKENKQWTGNKGGGFAKEPFEERCVGFAYSYSKDLAVARPDWDGAKIIATANALVDAMIATKNRVKP